MARIGSAGKKLAARMNLIESACEVALFNSLKLDELFTRDFNFAGLLRPLRQWGQSLR
jgi:hypothetical protein